MLKALLVIWVVGQPHFSKHENMASCVMTGDSLMTYVSGQSFMPVAKWATSYTCYEVQSSVTRKPVDLFYEPQHLPQNFRKILRRP